MTKVQLTQELVKSIFDYNDGLLYWKVNIGQRGIAGQKAGNINPYLNRVKIKLNRKTYSAARLIFLWHHGYLPEIIDHIDRDTLNDRIENLRAATPVQNASNKSKSQKRRSSIYLGVSFDKQYVKWFSSIKHAEVRIVKMHNTENEAALAYNREAVRYHKEFANLNIIQPQ